MNSRTDKQLLRDYTEDRSEAAFVELVRRHVDFVYSAALRMVRDTHMAQDVTQSVFATLAQNALRLMDRPILSGWLHLTTRNLAANAVRSEVRRRAREHEAAAMNELEEADPVWHEVAPHLDAALAELSDSDRDAILLRYFERKSAHEIAETLGISDDAAQKRVSRAVERLRAFFAKRGVPVGASGLGIVISTNAVQAAPASLIVTIPAALAGTVIQTSTTIATTQAIAMTTLQKAIIGTTLSIAVGTGVYEAFHASRMREQNQALQQESAQLAEQTQQLTNERDGANKKLLALQEDNQRLRGNTTELFKLRGELARLQNDSREVARLKAAGAYEEPDQSVPDPRLTRVDQLKQRLEQTPNAKIPELQLLTEDDWLTAANTELQTDGDYRKAFAQLRNRGENKFLLSMQSALQEFLKASGGQFPIDVSQLKPFFKTPPDDAMLQRYDIMPAVLGDIILEGREIGGDFITLKHAVDEEDDTLWYLGANTFGSTSFPGAYEIAALAPALADYAAVNNGQTPSAPSDLLPYLTTLEELAAYRKLEEIREMR